MTKRSDIAIGDRVTVTTRQRAYSLTHGSVDPGVVGIVGAIRVPYVFRIAGFPAEFVCVDFFIEGKEPHRLTDDFVVISSERAGVDYNNIVKLPDDTPITNLPEGDLDHFCGQWNVYRRAVLL